MHPLMNRFHADERRRLMALLDLKESSAPLLSPRPVTALLSIVTRSDPEVLLAQTCTAWSTFSMKLVRSNEITSSPV